MRTWADASTLIALDACGELGLLKSLFDRVFITEQVRREVLAGRETAAMREALRDWIKVEAVRGDLRRWRSLGLGDGEASLFLTPEEDRLLLDEIPARTVAEAEGRQYTGLLCLLLAGVEAGVPPASRAREILEKLARSSFRMRADLYGEVLRRLGDEG